MSTMTKPPTCSALRSYEAGAATIAPCDYFGSHLCAPSEVVLAIAEALPEVTGK